MKPLIVLLSVFVLGLMWTGFFGCGVDPAWSGRIAMSAMLIFTGIAHFAFTKGILVLPIPSLI